MKTSKMEGHSQSVPELCLYTFTNRKYKMRAIFPHEGRRIIKERTQSSNARELGQRRPKTNAHLQRMKLPPISEHHKRFQSTRQYVSRVKTPGYTLLRSASAVEMKINMDKFFEPARVMQKFRSSGSKKDDAKIGDQSLTEMIHRLTKESIEAEEKLQREIVNLSVKLKNQEVQYQEQIQQYEKERKDFKKKIEMQYVSEQKYMASLHEQQMQILTEKFQQNLALQKSQFVLEKAGLEKEIAEHQDLLKETKKKLRKETDTRLRELESTIKEEHINEIKKLKSGMKEETETIILEAKQEVADQYEEEMSNMAKMYKTQIEGMVEKVNRSDYLAKRLATTEDSLKICQDTVKYVAEQLKTTNEEKQSSEIQLLKTSEELKDLKNNFNDKVNDVEKRFMKQLDNLRLENSQIRGRVIQLSQEAVSYQTQINEINIKGRLSSKLRLRTALKAQRNSEKQVAAGPRGKITRCNSLPVTQKEMESRKVEEKDFEELLQRPYTTSYTFTKHNY